MSLLYCAIFLWAFLQLAVIHLRKIIMFKWLQSCLSWPHYYPCRIKKRPGKVLPSEHANLLTPMSAFGLRNRYLSRYACRPKEVYSITLTLRQLLDDLLKDSSVSSSVVFFPLSFLIPSVLSAPGTLLYPSVISRPQDCSEMMPAIYWSFAKLHCNSYSRCVC